MKMGMDGAMNGIINSILITDGNRYTTYGLIVIKRTVQYALVLLQKGRAKLCQNRCGFVSHCFGTFQWLNFHRMDPSSLEATL